MAVPAQWTNANTGAGFGSPASIGVTRAGGVWWWLSYATGWTAPFMSLKGDVASSDGTSWSGYGGVSGKFLNWTNLNCKIFTNGADQYAFAGYYANSAGSSAGGEIRVVYRNSAAAADPWLTKQVIVNDAYSLNSMTFGNGRWVVCGSVGSSGSGFIAYSDSDTLSASTTWTIVTSASGTGYATSTDIRDIFYDVENSLWVTTGRVAGSGNPVLVRYTSNALPDGGWSSGTSLSGQFCRYVQKLNGYYAVTGSSGIFVSTSLTGSWTQVASPHRDLTYGTYLGEPLWVACGGANGTIAVNATTDPAGTYYSMSALPSGSNFLDVESDGSVFVAQNQDVTTANGTRYLLSDPMTPTTVPNTDFIWDATVTQILPPTSVTEPNVATYFR